MGMCSILRGRLRGSLVKSTCEDGEVYCSRWSHLHIFICIGISNYFMISAQMTNFSRSKNQIYCTLKLSGDSQVRPPHPPLFPQTSLHKENRANGIYRREDVWYSPPHSKRNILLKRGDQYRSDNSNHQKPHSPKPTQSLNHPPK